MMNPENYVTLSEVELSYILSHFNEEYILNILNYHLENKTDPNKFLSGTNIVRSIEIDMNMIKNKYNYAEFITKINDIRLDVYKNILDRINKEYNYKLIYNLNDDIDIYSVTNIIYDFFVGNYTKYIITFISRFIYNEKDEIYDKISNSNNKKNKNSSIIYTKKRIDDPKIALISANIIDVINDITELKISLEQVANTVLDANKALFLTSIVNSIDDNFFLLYIKDIINNESVIPSIITLIRLEILNIFTGNEKGM